jgi:ABC-type ATPase involved in cell division
MQRPCGRVSDAPTKVSGTASSQRPSRGAIRMFGQDLMTMPRERLPDLRRRLGVVFQNILEFNTRWILLQEPWVKL